MSTTSPAPIERRGTFAIQMLQDSAILGLVATAILAVVAGTALLQAILAFGAACIGIFVGTLLIQAVCNAQRESLARKLIGWLAVSLALAAAYRPWIGGAAWLLGGVALAITGLHTLILHRVADLEFRSEQAEKAGNRALAGRLADEARAARTLPPNLERLVGALPSDLDADLRARIDDAVAAHLQLHDLLGDPGFVAISGVLPDAITRACEEHLAELTRRAPLLAKVRRLAAETPADPAGAEATRTGLCLLDARVAALQALARAALHLAATEQPAELSRFQDASDRLLAALD